MTIVEGETSHDSLRIQDILSGVRNLLTPALLEEIDTAIEEEDEAILADLMWEMAEYLNDIAPDYLIWGASEQDGASFGFWRNEDAY